MAYIPPTGSYGNPPKPWDAESQGPDDGRSGGWKPPGLSTTHVILGLIAILVLAGIASQLLGTSLREPDVAIVSPREDSEWPAGEVAVRLRVSVPELEEWRLLYAGPGATDQWQEATTGGFSVYPDMSGEHNLFLTEAGRYQLRLLARDKEGAEFEDATEFVLTP